MNTSPKGKIVAQGETVVGAATVALSSVSYACDWVWVGAPTASNTKGAANTSEIKIGGSASSNASGGRSLPTDMDIGFNIPITDAKLLYCTGTTAGDAVEWQAWQKLDF